jgi:plastocyanin
VLAAAALAAACGGARAITRTQDGVTVDADVPVRISDAAVKPALVHLYQGHVVTFINDDRVPRTLGVDAVKSDVAGCATVGIGTLQPGEQRSASLPFFAACYYRDEQRPAAAAFQGVVVTHDR